MDLLRRYFLPADVDVIISIRTSTRVTEDIIAWAPERNGIFTVRSAYRLAMDERERPSASATSRAPDGRRAIWKIIWGCPAPPKVSPGKRALASYGLGLEHPQGGGHRQHWPRVDLFTAGPLG
nr:uncharacterized protein LOC123497417 [Aegilops tauschii subsp. strangulata]